jgi:hypothetical protein
MGVPPMRIGVLNRIAGVEFDACYPARRTLEIDGVLIPLFSLEHLRASRKASGRSKDLDDLENLPCSRIRAFTPPQC